MYFLSTSGGNARGPANDPDGFGQLWHYVPADGRLRSHDELVLVFESPSGSVLEAPDNLCITPNGAMLFCEDDVVNDSDTNVLRRRHFQPRREILFVNLFGDATPGSGMTCAIWGPWERGPL